MSGRVHRSVRVVDGPHETQASIITTWTPGTPIEMVEEAIKAANREGVRAAREGVRAAREGVRAAHEAARVEQ